MTELARPLILNDPLHSETALAISFEKLGNPGTALIPPAQISIDLWPMGRGCAVARGVPL